MKAIVVVESHGAALPAASAYEAPRVRSIYAPAAPLQRNCGKALQLL
jgi:hypothetical protein